MEFYDWFDKNYTNLDRNFSDDLSSPDVVIENIIKSCLSDLYVYPDLLSLYQLYVIDFIKFKISEHGLRYLSTISKSEFSRTYVSKITKEESKLLDSEDAINDIRNTINFFKNNHVDKIYEWQVPYYSFWINYPFGKGQPKNFVNKNLSDLSRFVHSLSEYLYSDKISYKDMIFYKLEKDFSFNHHVRISKQINKYNLVNEPLKLIRVLNDLTILEDFPILTSRNSLFHSYFTDNSKREKYIEIAVTLKHLILPYIDYYIYLYMDRLSKKKYPIKLLINKKVFKKHYSNYINYRVTEIDDKIYNKYRETLNQVNKFNNVFQIEYNKYEHSKKNTSNGYYIESKFYYHYKENLNNLPFNDAYLFHIILSEIINYYTSL